MKHENKRAYLAPSAEVICLVPSESVASSGWTFGGGKDSWLWDPNGKFVWGTEVPQTVSITANVLWTDEIDLTED